VSTEEVTFGQMLRSFRLAKGFGLRDFAGKVGISPTYLSRLELGQLPPPVEDKIRKISLLLELDEDEFLGLAGKVSSDVVDIIRQDAHGWASLLRSGKTFSVWSVGPETRKVSHPLKPGSEIIGPCEAKIRIVQELAGNPRQLVEYVYTPNFYLACFLESSNHALLGIDFLSGSPEFKFLHGGEQLAAIDAYFANDASVRPLDFVAAIKRVEAFLEQTGGNNDAPE
jgi:HTH-type transcriptional regulator, competence development regulator